MPSPLTPRPLPRCVALCMAGLAGVGEARHSHPARLGGHAVPLGARPTRPEDELGHEAHAATAGAASFVGQTQCKCVADGKCTCKGSCTCSNCVGEHTEEQLRGKEQPLHPRPGVTGI